MELLVKILVCFLAGAGAGIGTGVRIGKTRVRVQSSGFGTPVACIGVRPSGGAPFGRQFLTGQAHGSPYRLISRRKIK